MLYEELPAMLYKGFPTMVYKGLPAIFFIRDYGLCCMRYYWLWCISDYRRCCIRDYRLFCMRYYWLCCIKDYRLSLSTVSLQLLSFDNPIYGSSRHGDDDLDHVSLASGREESHDLLPYTVRRARKQRKWIIVGAVLIAIIIIAVALGVHFGSEYDWALREVKLVYIVNGDTVRSQCLTPHSHQGRPTGQCLL